MDKTENIVAISTKVAGETVYVRGSSTCYNNKLIPHFTNDEKHAHDYLTDIYAQNCIDRFVNPNHRQFEIVNLIVRLADDKQPGLKDG